MYVHTHNGHYFAFLLSLHFLESAINCMGAVFKLIEMQVYFLDGVTFKSALCLCLDLQWPFFILIFYSQQQGFGFFFYTLYVRIAQVLVSYRKSL